MQHIDTVGLIEIVAGSALLIAASSGRAGSAPGEATRTGKLQRRRGARQLLYSLCGLLLVVTGLASQQRSPPSGGLGPCAEGGPGSPAAAAQCLHGALRLPRGR